MTYMPLTPAPRLALSALVDTHGSRAVLAALLRVLASRVRLRRATRANAALLSDHLRRDVGLPPVAPGAQLWQIF